MCLKKSRRDETRANDCSYPDPPQDDTTLHEGKCEELQREEKLPREREEFLPQLHSDQKSEENLTRERGEFLPQLHEEQQREENSSQERKEFLPQLREEHITQEFEERDRKRERVEHGVSKCEDEGDIFNADMLLDFLKTIGDLNLPSLTSNIDTPQTSTTMDVPQPPTLCTLYHINYFSLNKSCKF